MGAINGILRTIFDLILAPLSGLPPLVGVVLVSAIISVFMLLVFKWTSDQDAMDKVKRRIHASLFEIRLFNDDLVNIFRSSVDIVKHNVYYVRLTLLPLLIMIVPLVLVVAQLQFHYGYQNLKPGTSTLLKVELTPEQASRPTVQLKAPEGVSVEAGPVWVPSKHELGWRIKPQAAGDHVLTLELDGQSYTKSLAVSDKIVRRSPFRLAKGFWNQLLYPAEDPLPAGSPIQSISLDMDDAEVGAMGFATHWIILFLVLSVVFAFAFRKPLGVNI